MVVFCKTQESRFITDQRHLFSQCIQHERLPESWHNAMVILQHKKGDQKEVIIALLVCYQGPHEQIYQNFKQKSRTQSRFRQRYSALGHLHTINQLIEGTAE